MNTGIIYDIKRYAINDGPGIRVTVFMKGCPLSCAWCHNPEGISPEMQRVYSPGKCIGCQQCIQTCPEKACSMTPEGISVDTRQCTTCGTCAAVCPTTAVEIFGRRVSVDEVVREVEKDRLFFDQSGGGVTFSGGEPLVQADFLLDLLMAFGRRSIHRTVDTTGFAPSETLLKIAAHTDLFLFDLKLIKAEHHKKWTGVSNRRILENIGLLAKSKARILIRIPLINGVNADDDNIQGTAQFLSALPGPPPCVNLLPYHNIMAGKYARLGQSFNENSTMSAPDKNRIEAAIKTFAQYDIAASVGG